MLGRMLKRTFCTNVVDPVKGYSLYTWGSQMNALGYKPKQALAGLVSEPTCISNFDGRIKKVKMGQNHSACITVDGELYTFGSGKYGSLGLDDGNKNHSLPHKVDYFEKKGLKVKDVALGLHHTIALTEDGQVYSWGQARRKMWFGFDYLFPPTGALGHNSSQHLSKPKKISCFEGQNVTHISSGNSFATALTNEKDLYIWGRGEYGTLGNGRNKQHKTPIKNDLIEEFKEKMDLEIVDLCSIFRMTSALMSNF